MEFRFSKTLYPKSVLLNSAYNFTDRAYIHLDESGENYIVHITSKDNSQIEYREFENEMLAQAIRHEIYQQTKELRQLTVARAMASTLVEETPVLESEEEHFDLDDVMKDWFEREDT